MNRLIRGELDWVVMKALEKDRTRRYDTVAALAADVRHHLAGEPVLAVPPTLGYRLRKFVRRNRPMLATAAAVTGSLVLAVGALSAGLIVIDRQQQTTQSALDAETLARKELATSLQRERAAQGELLLSLARQHWLMGDLGNAVHYLERCPLDLRGREWRYLHRVSHSKLASLRGARGSSASVVRFTHDRKLIAVTSHDRPLVLWDATTGEERTQPLPERPLDVVINGQMPLPAEVRRVTLTGVPAFTTDGRRVILAGQYSFISPRKGSGAEPRLATVLIDYWEPTAGPQVQRVRWSGPAGAGQYTPSPDGVCLSVPMVDGGVIALDILTGQERLTFAAGHKVLLLTYSESGHRLAGFCLDDLSVRVWDTTTGKETGAITKVPQPIGRLVLSPDGRLVAVLSSSYGPIPGTVRVWSLDTGRKLCDCPDQRAGCGTFSPDGRYLAIGGGLNNSSVTVLDVTTGRTGLVFRGFHPVPVTSLVFYPDSRRLVSASADGTVNILDATPFEEVADPGDVNAGR